ncbi:MAG: protein-tyrosine-phosphatase [Chloroflexi bacterium]|nr:MAG: protein-tyrosine-phosphatase [Chloroflexota bacterium]
MCDDAHEALPFAELPLADLHTHVVPRLDDGASTDEMALRMLRAAEADGTTTVVATPHSHHARAADILRGVELLREQAAAAGVRVDVLPGSEARITSRLVEQYANGELVTLNGTTWVLIELYLGDEWPFELVEKALDRLQAGGLRPVLAHAERYPMVQRAPRLMEAIAARGIPVQLNAGSLFGENGLLAQKAAESLLAKRLAHLIASDAHAAGWRQPVIRAAHLRAAELAGEDYARWMASVPWAILAGDDVALPQPLPPET